MKRLIIIFSLIWAGAQYICAQSVQGGHSFFASKDSIAKKIVDKTNYLVVYDYWFLRNPGNPKSAKRGITFLEIGNHYNRFGDLYKQRYDSIIDENFKGHIPDSEMMGIMPGVMKRITFDENILMDREKGEEIVQRTAGSTQKYQYTEPIPELTWEMVEGDTIIAGYNCKKAITSLFGRDYEAWYAPEIPLPFGPYKFNGLPGLIFRVMDTNEQYVFRLNGLEQTKYYRPIYLWTKKNIIKTSRDKVRKIYKNYCNDPLSVFNGDDGVHIPIGSREGVKPKSYNPIELE